jgi:DNA mismatch repair protein MLH3
MANATSAIRPLPDAVRSQIKSSVEITTLSDVVERLLQNCLDADSSNVRIEIDYKTGFCAVTDDGCGIPASDFAKNGHLARPYCTSKSNGSNTFGNTGQSLAHIAALGLVSIASRVVGGVPQQLRLRHSERIHTGCGEDLVEQLKGSGTKVVVNNLFARLPVRYKAHSLLAEDPAKLQRQFERLKIRLAGYMLAFQKPVNLRLVHRGTMLSYTHKSLNTRNIVSSFSTKAIQNTMRQAGFTSAIEAGSWKLASAKSAGLTIRVAVNMEPRPSKETQFISLANQPLSRSGLGAALFDTINKLFDDSNFGTVPQTPDKKGARPTVTQHTLRSLRGLQVKGADRWPCFYVRIDTSSPHMRSVLSSRNEAENPPGQVFQQIVALLTMLVEQLLRSQHLRKREHQSRRRRFEKVPRVTRLPTANDTYDRWSRSRAAYPDQVEDFRSGLPFVSQKDASTAIDADVQLLLDDMENDEAESVSFGSTSAATQASSSPTEANVPTLENSADEDVTWTNPQTGKTVRLNSNSFAIPWESLVEHDRSVSKSDCRQCLASHQRLPKRSFPTQDLSDRLRRWPTSTFKTSSEAAIPSIAVDFEHRLSASRGAMAVTEETLSVQSLSQAKVIQQVNDKFILAIVDGKLVLIDQHAADERVKVEALYEKLCEAQPTRLNRPVLIGCNEEEAQRFDQAQAYFASWAICYDRSEGARDTIRVTHLPDLIAERCRQEPRILIDLMRKEIWADNPRNVSLPMKRSASWVDRMIHCPADLMEMINSRACRSAIMFNDVLTNDECVCLVRSLATCTLPFQCAHGRPSLAILMNIGKCGLGHETNAGDFGKAFRDWV